MAQGPTGVRLRIRLSDEDLAKYGGDEWQTYDELEVARQPASVLIAVEAAMGGYTLARMTTDWLLNGSAKSKLALAFVARRLNGHTDDWARFDPRIMLAQFQAIPTEDSAGEDQAAVEAGGDAGNPPAAASARSRKSSEAKASRSSSTS